MPYPTAASLTAPLRPFRSDLLRRLLALTLVVGLSAPLVPTASAQDTLTSALDDERAFEAALRAAHAAEGDPVAAFAEAYALATGGAVTAEAVERLIGGASMSGVLPAVADPGFAQAHRAVALGGAVVVSAEATPTLVAHTARLGATAEEAPTVPIASEARPRAP